MASVTRGGNVDSGLRGKGTWPEDGVPEGGLRTGVDTHSSVVGPVEGPHGGLLESDCQLLDLPAVGGSGHVTQHLAASVFLICKVGIITFTS